MQTRTRPISAVSVVLAALSCLAAPAVSRAQSYDVSVTRTAGDFYKVVGKDIVIQTRRCDVPATARSSVFKADDAMPKLVFVDGGAHDCDVKAAYGPTMANPGSFAVTVRHDADDWYEVSGAGTYIRTSSCGEAAASRQPATLSLGAANAGRLVFGDGTSCTVEGLYDKLPI
jgi:hypothetical protein